MTDFLLTAPIIAALQARLVAELPAELTARQVGIPADQAAMLKPPAKVLDFAPPPAYVTDFPTIGLLDEASDLEDDTGATATGKHGVGVMIWLQSPDQGLLAWGLRRYAGAVLAVALRGRSLGNGSADGAWGTGGGRVRWGPSFEDEENPRVIASFCVVSIWARREEQQN